MISAHDSFLLLVPAALWFMAQLIGHVFVHVQDINNGGE